MNANELANEILEFYHDPDGLPYLIGEAATMLRQLQSENEALKKSLDVALMIVNTHPAELTDEEIEEIAEYYGVEDIGICDFVRAILRKEQEK